MKIEKSLPKIIATINFKGGVGKTTMTWGIGDYISTYRDNNVIMFDIDAQMSLTQAMAMNLDGSTVDGFRMFDNRARQDKKTTFNALVEYIKTGEINLDIDDNLSPLRKVLINLL